jgi:hypothetical protein
MAFTDNQKLRDILWPRIEKPLLEGFFGGKFNEAEYRFYAATLVSIKDVEYYNFEYHHSKLESWAAKYHDSEKTQKLVSDNSWQSKSMRECVGDGAFHYFSILFTGVYHEGDWYILKNLTFYGDQKSAEEIKEDFDSPFYHSWDNMLFKPNEPKTYNIAGKPVSYRDVQLEEFKNDPFIAANIKQQKKEKVNKAFVNYVSEAFLYPFFDKLRLYDLAKYTAFVPLRIQHVMIFPKDKKQVIICPFVENSEGEQYLKYYLLEPASGHFYEWTYFDSKIYDGTFFGGDLIINDLKTVSDWDDIGFLDSSRTLDDENFWQEYVFKQKDGEYFYLKPVTL